MLESLYIWVHPEWDLVLHRESIVDKELEEYQSFIDTVRKQNTGLIHVPSASRDNYSNSPAYQKFIQGLQEIDRNAKEALNEKYVRWNKRFVNAKDPLQKNTLDAFAPTVIHVFGKELDTCPLAQAAQWGLQTIAPVYYHRQETPHGITKQTGIRIY